MTAEGADLIFPHLGITIKHMVNHISVFGVDIAFYGIIIGVGMCLALLLAIRNAKAENIDTDTCYNFFFVAVICGIIGARVYYVVFNFDLYRGDFMKMLNIREGGLAIYGGIIGGILSALVYSKLTHFPFIKLTDIAMPSVYVGQILGRFGNFFNCEAFGGYTDSLFAMRIKESIVNPSMINDALKSNIIVDEGIRYIQVHPTFLYESVWNLLSLIVALKVLKKTGAGTGYTTICYFLLYGIGRFFIESLRTDSLLIPGTNLAVSKYLSLLLAVIMGIILAVRLIKKYNNKAIQQ